MIKILVRFIVTTYTPVWFDIKNKHYVVHGPGHLFKVVQIIQYFAEDLKILVIPLSYHLMIQ